MAKFISKYPDKKLGFHRCGSSEITFPRSGLSMPPPDDDLEPIMDMAGERWYSPAGMDPKALNLLDMGEAIATYGGGLKIKEHIIVFSEHYWAVRTG